ncbi:F-box/RNI-like/FBD-like domains-containing protein [Striga asiatica]|uniref:F-box/RNI-like/FBD-like domains-containing protein n=1 Tax=Striga asiatica TaxID=4170 RepID=A0A5A7RAH3_STRAF|nr:F-box/RNI-like/FBD-like domains-containing protein [Striga asiatica]
MAKTEESIDRLSALPNDVVTQILARLPTKLSVSTSVLARGWTSLWAHVPNLDLYGHASRSRVRMTLGDTTGGVPCRQMLQSINASLLNRPYDYHHVRDEDEIHKLIWSAFACDLLSINIDMYEFNQVPYYPPRFTCETLVQLRLHATGNLRSSDTENLYFPSLKKLELSHFFYDSDALPRFLSGCPVLVELTLSCVPITDFLIDDEPPICHISSPTLERFTLIPGFSDNPGLYNSPNLRINFPALKYLTMGKSTHEVIFTSQLPSLIEADVNFRGRSRWNIPELAEFIDCLSNVKCFRLLHIRRTKIVDDHAFFKFDNLTRLEIQEHGHPQFMMKILESADNLEILSIFDARLTCWEEPGRVPMCLFLRLRFLRISSDVYGRHDREMMSYVLRNAKVLEKMEIRFMGRRKTKLKEPIDRLSALPNDVVTQILARLPTKLSVSTSVLARGWTSLWAHVPNLDLYGHASSSRVRMTFRDTNGGTPSRHMLQSINASLLNSAYDCPVFVENSAHDYHALDEVHKLIRSAFACDLLSIDIDMYEFNMEPYYPLQFTCETLVQLRLHATGNLGSSDTENLYFPSLKKLELSDQICHISSPTLERFTLVPLVCHTPSLQIKFPTLKYLTMGKATHKVIFTSQLPSLIEADVSFGGRSGWNSPELAEFLDCLSNVKCFRLLDSYWTKIVDDHAVFKFDNLTRLEIQPHGHSQFMMKILESTDNLEILSIFDARLTYWEEPRRIPTCFLLRLRTLRMSSDVYGRHDRDMMSYFLRHAKVVEKVEIRFMGCRKTKLSAIEQMLLCDAERRYEKQLLYSEGEPKAWELVFIN